MRRLRDAVDRTLTEVVGSILLMIFLLNLYQVVGRYLLGMGAVWIPDVTRFLFIWMAFLGTALMHLRDRHLLIDYVQLRLPPAVRWGTGGVIHMAMVSLAGVLLVVGWRVTQLRMDIPYTGWEVPTGYAVLALPAGAALIGFTSLGKLWAWWRGEGGTEPRGRA